MFAYCGNSPVNRADPSGQFWKGISQFAATVVMQMGRAMGIIAPAYGACAGVAVADGPLPIGDAIGFLGAAVLTIGVVGYATCQTIKSSPISIPKVKEKEKDITATQPSTTVIYRYGGTNPGSLTPSQRDVGLFPITGEGLSFSTIPKPGAAMTTIEALNATGVVYAVKDGAGHGSVHPIGGTLTDWHNAGSSSVWTHRL